VDRQKCGWKRLHRNGIKLVELGKSDTLPDDEPQYDPRPTVAVRLVSVLENAITNEGQISYLKGYHRLGGWFPREAKYPASVR